MSSVIEWFLRDNHWIRMVLLNLPLQLFAVKILELLVGKMKHKGYMIGFMLVRTTLLCYFQSLGDQISVSGHLAEIVLGALGSIGACLLCIYLVEAEPIRVLFAIAISELSAMPVMVFSMVVLNWLEKRPEGMFGWYLTFRPEDLLAWIFELLLFIPIYAIMKKIQILFRNYEIRHTRLIWIIYLEYFLVMQTSQLIPIATEDGTRRGMVLPCLMVAAAATFGLVKIFSNQKEKIRTENQFLQLELTMMQSQYQAMQYQRSHIEESQKLIDRQMQEIMQKSEQSEKQEQVAGYLVDLENTYQNIHAGIYCKDWTLDAILYTEIERARQQGISVTCKVQNYPKDQDGIQCMGKVLVTLFEYAITESKKTDGSKKDGSKKPQIDVQIDVIANQAVVLFTCQAENGTRALKKKLDELTKEREGNTEIDKKDRICVGTVFAGDVFTGDGVFRHC